MKSEPPRALGIEVLEDPEQTSEAIRPAFEYWRAQCAGAWAPSIAAFQLDSLPLRLIPWCVVVDVTEDPLDFVYRWEPNGPACSAAI